MEGIYENRNKILCSYLLLIVFLITLPVYASAITVSFNCKDNSDNYIASSTLQVVTSTGITREPYSMPSGTKSLSMNAGDKFGYNMEANNYAKRYSSSSMSTVPSTSLACTLKLTPKSTYQSYGYSSPLSSLTVTSEFGWRVYSNGSSYTRDCHYGIDYAGSDGVTNIYSISDAESYSTGWDNSSGNYISIVSDSFTITYRHMASYSSTVTGNKTVSEGTNIGKVGQTGGVTGPHLHIDIYASGTYRDPAAFYN